MTAFTLVLGNDESHIAVQEAVFREVAPLVRSCADGYNACIFAYGQTGSGKTYTMQGLAEAPGVNTRALEELFKIAAEEPDKGWTFTVSMMEIYNDAGEKAVAWCGSRILWWA